MPQQQPMKSQKGSVLVGMVALSAVLTMVAGGYLFATANSGSEVEKSADENGLHYAAETGMQIGVRWMRNYYPTFFNETWSGSWIITPGGDFAVIDGYKIKVKIQGNPTPP